VLFRSGDRVRSVSRYELLEELGEGGMGTVFLGNMISEGGVRKPVAVKVLKDNTDESAIAKLVQEAKLLVDLSQGTIVEMIALESMELSLPGRRDPRTRRPAPPKKQKMYFMVLEYVNGPSLESVLKRHADNGLLMHPAMVGFLLNKTVIALAEAHTLAGEDGRPLGLVHRDISPSNILFQARAGITKLADFGVAKAFAEGDGEKRRLVGKPRYMAPEQLDGIATAASDIWALGVVGYEALTGFAPYRPYGKDTRERVESLREQMRYALRAPKDFLQIQDPHFRFEKLSDAVMACLQLLPEKRPTSLELNAMLEGEYLYAHGLGPTNKTLAAYLRLLECAIGEGEVIPPANFDGGEDAKVLSATLHPQEPLAYFRRRTTASYAPEFVRAVKEKHANPCLLPDSGGTAFCL
jgi:eukaryotic-like serine/threonine-protein kinase